MLDRIVSEIVSLWASIDVLVAHNSAQEGGSCCFCRRQSHLVYVAVSKPSETGPPHILKRTPIS